MMNQSASKPIRTKRIPLEGKVSKPRPKPRIVLEVEHEISMTVEGHYLNARVIPGTSTCEHTTSRIEIYEDRLDDLVANKLRDAKALEAIEGAERMCSFHVEEWQREHSSAFRGMDERERAKYTAEHCLLWAGQYLPGFGFRHGAPNLLAVRVVSQIDDTKTCSVEDFQTMDDTARSEYVGSAPSTPDNALDRTGTMIAEALARAMAINAASPNTKTPKK